MLAQCRHSVPNRANSLEILVEPLRLVRKTLLGGGKRRIKPPRQNKGFAEQWTSYFVQISDIDECDVTAKTERLQNRRLRILSVEPVDLMERSLDGESAMSIDSRSAAEIVVTLQ